MTCEPPAGRRAERNRRSDGERLPLGRDLRVPEILCASRSIVFSSSSARPGLWWNSQSCPARMDRGEPRALPPVAVAPALVGRELVGREVRVEHDGARPAMKAPSAPIDGLVAELVVGRVDQIALCAADAVAEGAAGWFSGCARISKAPICRSPGCTTWTVGWQRQALVRDRKEGRLEHRVDRALGQRRRPDGRAPAGTEERPEERESLQVIRVVVREEDRRRGVVPRSAPHPARRCPSRHRARGRCPARRRSSRGTACCSRRRSTRSSPTARSRGRPEADMHEASSLLRRRATSQAVGWRRRRPRIRRTHHARTTPQRPNMRRLPSPPQGPVPAVAPVGLLRRRARRGGPSAKTTARTATPGTFSSTTRLAARRTAGARTPSRASAIATSCWCSASPSGTDMIPILKERMFGLTSGQGQPRRGRKGVLLLPRQYAHAQLYADALQVSAGGVPI